MSGRVADIATVEWLASQRGALASWAKAETEGRADA